MVTNVMWIDDLKTIVSQSLIYQSSTLLRHADSTVFLIIQKKFGGVFKIYEAR